MYSKHRALLSNCEGWYYGAGHWVQHAECLLALLTFIWAYRKPPGTKDLQSALFSLAKTLPKHTKTLPHTQNVTPTEGLNRATWFFFNLFISGGFNAVGHPTCPSFWSQLWLAGDSLWQFLPSCCQAPRHICCGCDSFTAGLESVFSLSQIGGMSADFQTQPVEPAIRPPSGGQSAAR